MHNDIKILKCAVSISLDCDSLGLNAGNIGSVFALCQYLKIQRRKHPALLEHYLHEHLILGCHVRKTDLSNLMNKERLF